ncbi:hypothetical protein DFP95_104264 [Cohnella lupini]|uniref:Uncharacterized protein n=1 Tax=Cohnella lupini TaxID=1294267 RepID=A0A3D9IND5_9BACL|nr:hypothetical protein DFP95_104264 [Cohnella lupini]
MDRTIAATVNPRLLIVIITFKCVNTCSLNIVWFNSRMAIIQKSANYSILERMRF